MTACRRNFTVAPNALPPRSRASQVCGMRFLCRRWPMRYRIGQRRHKNLMPHTWDALERGGNAFGATVKFLLQAVIALLQKPVHRRHHADDLLLGDFHAAAHRLVMGAVAP